MDNTVVSWENGMAAIDTLLATWIWGGSLAKPYQDRKRPEGVVGAAVCLGHTVNLKANNNNKDMPSHHQPLAKSGTANSNFVVVERI